MSAGFNYFITRKGDKLYDGDREFRFVSINIPNIHINEDHALGWHRVDPWEMENAFKTINHFGGQVTRMYTLSIKGGIRPGENGQAHIYGPGQFDEQLFQDIDRVLELANKHKVRVIIPFIDQWDWFGGINQFAALRGKQQEAFWTDRELIDDFKDVITHFVNRVNTITGVPYKEDKAILAWETGNELDSPDEWTAEIVDHIRSLDSNHLILDGRYGVSDASIDNPTIDIVSNHYYTDRGADIVGRVQSDLKKSKGKKPFIIGEFNHEDVKMVRDVFETAVTGGATGLLLWSLRFHNKDGGFYYHEDPSNPNNPCYNWPGFPSRATNEVEKMQLMHSFAYRIQGLPVEPIAVPEPPVLLPIETTEAISWKGSVGARSYILERAQSEAGPWVVVAEDVMEDGVPFIPYRDVPSTKGAYFYRMKAKNESGVSVPSNIVKVIV